MHIGFNNQIYETCSILVVLKINEYSWSGSALWSGGLELKTPLGASFLFFFFSWHLSDVQVETWNLPIIEDRG